MEREPEATPVLNKEEAESWKKKGELPSDV